MNFEPSLFTDVPHKTYTLTWRHSKYTRSGLARCRFWCGSSYWRVSVSSTPIHAFVWFFKFDDSVFRQLRLTKAGKLVARSAIYQGV